MTGSVDGSRADGPLHAAAVYDSDDGLRARAVPFLRAGFDHGEAVLAVVPARVELALRTVLGGDGDRVRWREPALAHRRTGEAYEECRSFLAARHAAGEPARLLTGNDLDDADPDRLASYLRYEAASTAVFRPFGYPWVCLYDRRRHPARLLDDVGQVHPQVLTDEGRPVASTDYLVPAAYLGAHGGPLSPVPDAVPLDLPVTTPDELRAARHRLRTYASSLGNRRSVADRIEVAAHEVISNAVRHGGPPCRVRMWRTADVFHVRVDDRGHGGRMAQAGYAPPATSVGPGMGLWVARRLTDVVHTGSSPLSGTAVELQFR
jgi:anti-sigma regulatory factor (Ser/Thr protein kinase)